MTDHTDNLPPLPDTQAAEPQDVIGDALDRVSELKKLGADVIAFEAAGCPVDDMYDTYPPELWLPACPAAQLLLPLLERISQVVVELVRRVPDILTTAQADKEGEAK